MTLWIYSVVVILQFCRPAETIIQGVISGLNSILYQLMNQRDPWRDVAIIKLCYHYFHLHRAVASHVNMLFPVSSHVFSKRKKEVHPVNWTIKDLKLDTQLNSMLLLLSVAQFLPPTCRSDAALNNSLERWLGGVKHIYLASICLHVISPSLYLQ